MLALAGEAVQQQDEVQRDHLEAALGGVGHAPAA